MSSVDSVRQYSVTSTTGGSIGNTDSDFEPSGCCFSITDIAGPTNPVERGYASVLLNGLQLIRCNLPLPGKEETLTVSADEDMNITGEKGGLGIDALFITTHDPFPGSAWTATLECTCEGREDVEVDLGNLMQSQDASHSGHYIAYHPTTFTVKVQHMPIDNVKQGSAERQLVKEVRAILENPRLNVCRGSLGSIVLSNKAKESPLYDNVVGKCYGGAWQEFLRAHPGDFSLFHYSDEDIVENCLAPQIKKSDARVCLFGTPLSSVREIDKSRSKVQREDEENLKKALLGMLSEGPMSQKELLQKLNGFEVFTNSLFPSHSLLMRFLSRHDKTFVWTAGPDQPTRIGLASSDRILCHDSQHIKPSTSSTAQKHSLPRFLNQHIGFNMKPTSQQQPVYRHDPYSTVPFYYSQ